MDARAKILGILIALIIVSTDWNAAPRTLALFCALPLGAILFCEGSVRALLVRFSFATGFILLAAIFSFVLPVDDAQEMSVRAHRFWFLVFTTVFSVSSFYLLLISTANVNLMDGLLRLRIPRDIVWTMTLGLRYLPLLGDEGSRIRRAAVARGLMNGTKRVRTGGWMAAALIIRAFDRAIRTGRAMEGRGYDSRRAGIEQRPLLLRDWTFLLGYPGVVFAIRMLG